MTNKNRKENKNIKNDKQIYRDNIKCQKDDEKLKMSIKKF